MLAIDTNLIVRYLTGDHPGQAAEARELIDHDDVFVGTTVLLETEWVLRGAYGFPPADVVRALRAFAGLPRVTIEYPALAAQSLDWTEAGLDFADALHLAAAAHCDAFVSFDQRFTRMAATLGAVRTRAP